MNRLSVLALVAATSMTATVASAQSYPQRQQEYQQALRQNEQQQRDYRHARRTWARGQRLPSSYRSSHYMINDYRSRGWNRPPRGYAYYTTDNGDVVMAAIATGVIASIIANSNDRDHRGYDHR